MSEQRILEVNDVKVFIIPNKVGTVSSNLIERRRISEEKLFNKIFELNGIDHKIDIEKDELVQLWFHSKELSTNNLVRHGGRYKDESGEEIRVCPDIEMLPKDLFAGKREGDVIDLIVPANRSADGDILKMKVELDQLHYRYASFGPFEEVMEEV